MSKKQQLGWLCVALLSSIQYAQASVGQVTTEVRAHWVLNDPLLASDGVGVALGYGVSPRLKTQFRGAWLFPELSDLAQFLESEINLTKADVADTLKYYATAEVLYLLTPEDVLVTPMVGIGAGLFGSHYVPEDNPSGEDHLDFGLSAVACLDWKLNENLRLTNQISAFFVERRGAIGVGYGADAQEGSMLLEFSLGLAIGWGK